MTASPANKQAYGKWIRWLVLPLLLGAATVMLIARTEKKEVEIAINATVSHLSDDLLLMDNPLPAVRLLVAGIPSVLETIDPQAIACRLDLSGMREGTHTIRVHQADVELPKGVALQKLLTPSLTVRLETVSLKTVGVVAVLEGNPATGFAVAAVTLKPDHIVLKGTAAMLAGIDTVKTRPINLEAASESFKKEVALNLPDIIAVDPPLRIVVAHVEVKERIITRVLENIPVSAKEASGDFRITPPAITLTVSGPEAIVNTIETDPAFAVAVDLSGLSPGSHLLKAAINLPVRTALLSVSPERFSVTISK
ncbi:CdaR family protein [Desulfosarcina alkanivorans]|nr:CdaR family protein [Desulfosarcina alkanivorans]